jgi:hypothetical protein
MENNRLTRRTALAAIGGAGALAAVPVAAAASLGTADRTAWDQAYAKMMQAKGVYDAETARHRPRSSPPCDA